MTELLPPEAMGTFTLGPNESIINCWSGEDEAEVGENWIPLRYLVMTNLRVLIIEGKEEKHREGGRFVHHDGVSVTYSLTLDRELRSIPPPRYEKGEEDYYEGTKVVNPITSTSDSVVIGGVYFVTAEAEAIVDEVTFARSKVIPPDMPNAPDQQAPERQVVIKEVIKVRCRYCGALNLENDAKCSSCGAKVG